MRGLRAWAARLLDELHVLLLAARSPDVPWVAKAVALVVLAYAASPIDLIPDFIPLFGYLDDLILLPLGLLLARRLIPPAVLERCRTEVVSRQARPPSRRAGAAIVVVLWAASIAAVWFAWRAF